MTAAVEIDVDLARALLARMPDDDYLRPRLEAALGRAEHVPDVFDRLRQGHPVKIGEILSTHLTPADDDLDPLVIAAEELLDQPDPLAPHPRWDYVARATKTIHEIVVSDPAYVARADALNAYVRDTFDALGISIRHEPSLYVAIVVAGLLVEMAGNGLDQGHTTPDVVATIAKVSQSFTASLLDYLPKEARPWET